MILRERKRPSVGWVKESDLFALLDRSTRMHFQFGSHLNCVHPVSHVEEGPLVGAVVEEQNTVHLSEVALGQTSEALLTGCVPQLQAEHSAVNGDRLRMEVNAEGGCHVPHELVLA